MAVTLANLRSGSRQRADMVNSNFVEDPELDLYINDGKGELYNLLVLADEDYFAKPSSELPVASGNTFDVPTDFFKLSGVDKKEGSEWTEVRKYGSRERNRRTSGGRLSFVRYRLMGRKVYLTPAEDALGTYQLWYTPNSITLVNSNDAIEVELERWRRFIETYAAIQMRIKEETDISALTLQLNDIKADINALKKDRDQGECEVVQDFERSDLPYYDRRLF